MYLCSDVDNVVLYSWGSISHMTLIKAKCVIMVLSVKTHTIGNFKSTPQNKTAGDVYCSWVNINRGGLLCDKKGKANSFSDEPRDDENTLSRLQNDLNAI